MHLLGIDAPSGEISQHLLRASHGTMEAIRPSFVSIRSSCRLISNSSLRLKSRSKHVSEPEIFPPQNSCRDITAAQMPEISDESLR